MAFMFANGVAAAEDSILVINGASSSNTLAKNYQQNVENSTFYQSSSCQDALQKFSSTPNSVLIQTADAVTSARRANTGCSTDGLTKDSLIASTYSYYNFCTAGADPTDIKGQSRISLFGKKIIGMPASILTPNTIKDFINSGVEVKGVPYANSSAATAALINGSRDVRWVGSSSSNLDFGLLGVGATKSGIASKQLNCAYTTDPTAKNYIGKAFPQMTLPDWKEYVVIYINKLDPELRERALVGASTSTFAEFLKGQSYSALKTGKSIEEDINGWNNWLTKIQDHWGPVPSSNFTWLPGSPGSDHAPRWWLHF